MMRTTTQLVIRFVIVLCLVNTALAQENRSANDQKTALTVTAFASTDRVRFAAPSSAVQIRLEVYDSTGRKVFDNELRGGNVLDWHMQDGKAEPLADESYLCVVTVKSLSGKITQKIGSVIVEQRSASLQPVEPSQISAQQLQAIGPVEEDASLTVLEDDENQTAAVIAHNGEEGQITRGRGALSFRLGDFFKGKDVEQMRLTPEGNLGIGITHPQARLDVDGLIRTTRGIVFPDGTIQTTAAGASDSVAPPDRQAQAEKNSANLSELAGKAGKKDKRFRPELFVNEDLTVNGNIIFTPASPHVYRDITMQNNSGGLRFYGAPSLTNSPAAAAIQFWGNNSPFQGQLYLDSGAHDNGAVIIRTAGTGGTITERMRVTATGNVGIGTTSPGTNLQVAGSIRWGNGSAPPYVYSDEDAGGLYLEQVGTTAANSRMRLQSSVTGGHSEYSQFFIDPANGFSFVTTGGANGNVGIGTTNPTQGKLHVEGGTQTGVRGSSGSSTGVAGISTSGAGVSGISTSGFGMRGQSGSSIGVVANSTSGDLIAGFNSIPGFKFRVENNGTVHAPGYEGLPDFAEMILPSPADKCRLEPGDVLVAASNTDRSVSRSRKPYSTSVLGVYSTAPGFIGTENPLEGASSETIPMAVIGIVPCKVSAENGPIRRGDLLTTSRTPGHAMRCVSRRRCSAAIVGKALAALDRGTGVIKVLVSLQ